MSLQFDPKIASKLGCFLCGNPMMFCPCDASYGNHIQYILSDSDLPPPNAVLPHKIQFWGHLIKHNRFTCKFNFDLYYQEKVLDDGLLDLLVNQSIKDRFYGFYEQHRTSDRLDLVATQVKMDKNIVYRVGKDGLDSFFAGRWHEVNHLAVIVIMNAVAEHGPDPYTSSSGPLRKVTSVLQTIESVLLWVSHIPFFTIIALDRLESTKHLALCKILSD
jgi:hypothetical protein